MAVTNDATAGSASPGRAPPAASVTATSHPAKTPPRGASAPAAPLDPAAGGLLPPREVSRALFRAAAAEHEQAVALPLDLLAVVEHVRHTPARLGDQGGGAELDGAPGLQVAAAAAVEEARLNP